MDYFTTSDKVKIYYKLTGEGRPIIFIHGFTATHDVFRIPQKVLSKKYKVLSYDLRGHGLSNETYMELSIDILAKDLQELISYLKLDSIVLVGWSLGGSIILEYIRQFGIERIYKICFIDISPKAINDNSWNLGLYHGNYKCDDANKDMELIKTDWTKFGENFIKIMAPNLNNHQISIFFEKIRNNKPELMYYTWKSIIEKDYRDILDKIYVPTLLLFGDMSTLYSLDVGKYFNKTIPDSHLIIFENCSHLLVLENPIKFNRVLDEFIIR